MYYLKGRYNSRLALDPSYPKIDWKKFKDNEWSAFYGNVKEEIPPNTLTPIGKSIDMCMMVDSNHTGDKLTSRSHTGFLILCNLALINWLYKNQPTVESAVFRDEFVAMKHVVETLRGIWYKLRMMGVPIEGPSYIYGDNMFVIYNTSRP